MTKKISILKTKFLTLILLGVVAHPSKTLAVDYTYNNSLSPAFPGFPTTNPLDLQSGDTLNVTNGTMQISSSAGAAVATITGSNEPSSSPGQIITVQPGATISYAGTNPSGAAIKFSFNQYSYTMVNMGTISKGTGSTAIDLSGTASAFFAISMTGGGSIVGNLILKNNTSLSLDGSGSINGNITNSNSFVLGNTSAVSYTTQGTIDNVQNITLSSGTLTVGTSQPITNLSTAFSIAANTTATLNAAVSGTAATTNNGTLFIGSTGALNTTGTFTNTNNLNIASTFTTGTYSSFVNTGGKLYVIGSGGITGNLTTGASLNVGQDSTGAANACNYTLNGTIAGIPIIQVFNGSLTNSGVNTISGVNTSFTVNAGASAALGAQVSGTGTVTNNGTITISAANALNTSGALTNNNIITMAASWAPNTGASGFNLASAGSLNINGGTFTKPANFTYAGTINLNSTGAMSGVTTGNGSSAVLNIGPTTSNTFTTSASLSGINTYRVYQGSFTAQAGHTITGVNTSFTVDLGAAATFNSTFSGTGTVTNNGTLTLNTGSSLASFTTFTNNKTMQINATANGIAITNNSALTIAGNVTGAGSITNNNSAATLTLQTGTVNNSITNTLGNFNVTGAATTTSISNAATTTISAALHNTGSITNTGSFSASALLTNDTNFTNTGGTVSLTAGLTNGGFISNSGTFTVSGALSSTGTITNTGTTFTANGTVTGHGITNTSGTMTLNNTVNNTGAFSNSGTLLLNANLTNSGGFTTSNNFTMAGNISMAGQTHTASGTTTISGARTLTAANYNNSGTTYFTITNPSTNTYDSLTCPGCAINMSTGIVDITSNFTGVLSQPVTLTMVSGASLNPPSTSNIVLHNAFALNRMTASTTSTSIIVTLSPITFETLAYPGINQKIAAVLDAMARSPNLTADQLTFLSAIANSPNNAALNTNIHKLLPDFNSVDANIAVQDDTFRRIERRVASIRDGFVSPNNDTYIAGDLDYSHSMWISGFGGYTKQLSLQDNDGYRATSTGGLLGFDTTICRDNVFGIAIGMSGSDIKEESNPNFYTITLRYHALVYGSHNTFESTFVDWVLSGSTNNNRGNRPVFINNIDMSASSDYNSTLLSGKGTVSTSYDLGPHIRFTPLTSLQFTNINQEAYNESGGLSALHVNEQVESIFTWGVGGRFNFPVDEWPCYAMREIRFLLSYDAIIGSNDTTASFVLGSNSYTIANPLSKLALTMGVGFTYEIADYLQFQANYDLQIRKRFLDQVGMIKLRYLL